MAFGHIPKPGEPIQLGEFFLEDRRFPAVYFLCYRGEVVYVGQSRALMLRIDQHLEEGVKLFDAVAFVRCPFNLLTKIEGYYIRQMVPKYNACSLAKKVRERESWSAVKDRRSLRKTIQYVAPAGIDLTEEIKFVDAAECIVPPNEMGDFLQVSDRDVAEWQASGELSGDMSIIDMFHFMMSNSGKVRRAQETFEQL